MDFKAKQSYETNNKSKQQLMQGFTKIDEHTQKIQVGNTPNDRTYCT